MDRLFSPKKVAVVGVSDSEDNLGKNIVRNMLFLGYRGELFLYGSRECEIFGMRVERDFSEVPPDVDVCVVLTPARTVPSVVEAFSSRGVRRFVVESGGFSELGKGESIQYEAELRELARERGLLLIGPNCIGVVNASTGFATPFVSLEETGVRKGKVAVVAQSGGVAIQYLEFLSSEGIGISKFISMGNKLVLNEVDYLSHLNEDAETEVILLYLESVENGRKFYECLKGVKKPVVIHKGNVSELSRKIAMSHTAALSTREEFFRAAVKQAGKMCVYNTSEAVNSVKACLLPPLKKRDVAILSRSGGHAVIAADAAGARGLNLPDFSDRFVELVRSYYRAGVMEPVNPLDLGDIFDLDAYLDFIRRLMFEDEFGGVSFILGLFEKEWEKLDHLLYSLRALMEEFEKPVTLVLQGSRSRVLEAKQKGILPIFDTPEEGVFALSISLRFKDMFPTLRL